MAQKRRGLGRGLQALIPEAQVEAPARRPSDVFFPEAEQLATESERAEDRTNSGEGAAETSGHRSSDDIAATLLAPSPRSRPRRGKRPASTGSVSRETTRSQGAQRTAGESASERRRQGGAASGAAAARRKQRSPRREEVEAIAAQEPAAPVAVESPESSEAGDEGLVPVPGATFADLPVELIAANPRQPRQVFDEDETAELAASIKEVGLLQPIVVRRVENHEEGAAYELIMGERRLRAAKEAGMETIPAVVRYTEDEDLLRDALLENLHRVQLNPLEEAAAYQQLLDDFNCTHAELSARIARSRSQISNTLRLMKLPPLVQRRLAAGVLSAGHARSLLGLPDSAAMERVAQRIVAEGLSVRATEEIVALYDESGAGSGRKVMRARSTPLPALSTRLSDAFDTRVKVTRGAKKGRITIEFAGEDDLARIVSALAPGVSLDEE